MKSIPQQRPCAILDLFVKPGNNAFIAIVICDYPSRITYIHVEFLGTTHDVRVFLNIKIWHNLKKKLDQIIVPSI